MAYVIGHWPIPICHFELCPLLTARCSASLRAALVAVNFVAVRTRVIELFADFHEGVIISRLRYLVGELPHVHERRNVLLPVGAIHRYRSSVLTTAAWCHQQACAFRASNAGRID